MRTEHLGMYVHQHWGYAHPFSARTWTAADWRGYAYGLAALGYDTIMLWSVLETTPFPPTESDAANLAKLGRVIDMLHDELGFHVIVVLSANTVANERASQYRFEERPYFLCDERLNPARPAEVERLMLVRRGLLKYLARADGVAIIDSDPGGYVGSTHSEFAEILLRHIDLLAELNPTAQLYYWMWVGWEPYCDFWAEAQRLPSAPAAPKRDSSPWEPVLEELMARAASPWRLLVCWDEHRALAKRRGLQSRSMYLPYGLIEGEPTFPLTNYLPKEIGQRARAGLEEAGLGVMGNAQTHCVQLPNTFLLAHCASGGDVAAADLRHFGERLVPGCGVPLTEAWRAMGGGVARQKRAAADMLAERLLGRLEAGELGGLMLMSPDRYIEDMVLQLRFAADIDDCAASLYNGGVDPAALKAVAWSWRRWWARTRFNDAYGGPVAERLHPVLRSLRDPTLDAALNRHDEWRYPGVRHGVVPAALDALDALVK